MCHEKNARIPCTIMKHKALAEGVYELVLEAPGIVGEAKAGQFVNLYCKTGGKLLPRPISICETDREEGLLRLVYAVVGSGTREISGYPEGDQIEVMGPLGNGYTLDQGARHVLVGGGVGTPPLVELAKRLSGEKVIYLGFRTQPYLVESLREYGPVHVATDDGSQGHKGTVLELMEEHQVTGGMLYACGPTPMLRAVQAYALAKGIPSQLSLEERMGCGFGGCVGCVCKVRAEGGEGFAYKKVCKDGPVFDGKEVLLT
ncbi:dihydroorotate dehydrogenase electron transfer subunit [Anaerotalea alkaliphila]|uniref:Dihydroorotate dehydrogenase B (NAD(+)), electron transfer subunit n=1 Tax=Anaerotalea alkaliphila TaxID=2662126 RepID=A0A7X5HX00_9FIRM|nr:dihydroorotate dehydrogenase electron transfer subunit [Anaerotalea alkaliphila]NDL68187.1 dihydroorotate dehydrogenase electron transfer subunit [Anaerotalea alkaliphila]